MKIRAWSQMSKTMGEPFSLEDELLTNHFADNKDRFSPDTVFMISTGTVDRKGTEIFQGDIISCGQKNYMYGKNAEIVLNSDTEKGDNSTNYVGFKASVIGLKWKAHKVVTKKRMETCTVIGNIHQNPELVDESNLR